MDTSPEKPRNILLCMVDDLNLAVGAYGHPAAYTPNLDTLAARGLRFSHAFCPYPLCGPSRSALLTGRRPESFPMPNNEVCWRDLAPETRTIFEIARAHGFYTAGLGKLIHHGIPASQLEQWKAEHPDTNNPNTCADPPSYDEYWWEGDRDAVMQAEGPEQVIDGQPGRGNSQYTKRVTNPEILRDTRLADRAVDFLASAGRKREPFFAGVGFSKPHVPFVVPEKWWAFYDGLDVEALVPPTWFQPAELPRGTLKRDQIHRGMSEEQRRHLYRGYLASISYMDEQLGRVLRELDRQGLTESTLIVLVADHGYHIGEQGQWDKMMLLDPSLRVPMILAGPGVPSGATCDAVVQTLDLFPTLCAIMGWPEGEASAGTDLSPFIANPATPSETPAYGWIHTPKRHGWSIRTRNCRYGLLSWDGGRPEPYLFDLVKDPHETTNIASDPNQMETITDLDNRLRGHFASSKSPVPA